MHTLHNVNAYRKGCACWYVSSPWSIKWILMMFHTWEVYNKRFQVTYN